MHLEFSFRSTRMLIDVEPWVGLHSPSPSISLDLVWDDCTNASFVVEGGALNATCVRITADGWVPTLCNESYPFICEFKTTTGLFITTIMFLNSILLYFETSFLFLYANRMRMFKESR